MPQRSESARAFQYAYAEPTFGNAQLEGLDNAAAAARCLAFGPHLAYRPVEIPAPGGQLPVNTLSAEYLVEGFRTGTGMPYKP